MRRILTIAIAATIFPAVAAAQHHGGMAGGAGVASAAPHIMSVAPHGVARVGAPVRVSGAPTAVHRVQMNGSVRRSASVASGLRNLPLFPTSFSDAPGLGFDFAHFAAINGGRGSGRGFGHRRGFEGGLGFGFDGFLLSPGVVMVEGQPEEGQPVYEQAAANAAAPEAANDDSDLFVAALGKPAPLPKDAAEYVFVRRDGGLLFAVAYSWDNGTLRYVTREGVRRTVTRDALDMDATQQFNEQRGLNFRLPA